MPNMAQIVSRHNNQLLKQLEPKTPEVARTYSCPKAVRDSASSHWEGSACSPIPFTRPPSPRLTAARSRPTLD